MADNDMLNLLAPATKQVTLTNGNTVKIRKPCLATQNRLSLELLKLELRIPGDRLSLETFQIAMGLDEGLRSYDASNANWNAIVVEFILKQSTLWPIVLADVLNTSEEIVAVTAPDDALIILIEASKLFNWAQVKDLGRAFFSEIGVALDALRPKKEPPKGPEAGSPPGPIGASASSES